MKLANRLAVTAIILCCFNAQPAHSSDFVKSLLQQFSGTVVSWDDLESRHHTVEMQIRQALEAGNINLTDADQLRLQLNPVSQAVIQGRASGQPLSFTQGLSFSQTINSVTAALQQAVAAKQSTLPDIDALQTELSQKIDESLNANQLTHEDAARLKGELRTVADIESTIKGSGDGNLTARQIETISGRLSDIKTQLVQAIKMGQSAIPELNHRLAELQSHISTALSAGQIKNDQARRLTGELDRWGVQMQNYVRASQYLNGRQILELAGDLDRVSGDLHAAISADQAGRQATGPSVSTPVPNSSNDRPVTMLNSGPDQGNTPAAVLPPRAVQAVPQGQQQQILTIDNVEVTPSGKLSAGDVLTVRAFGTPGAVANFAVRDGVQGVPMDERRDGVYEGSYTVRKSDNIGHTRVFVSLSKRGAQPASGESRDDLMLDAMPPEIMVEPGPNTATGGQPNIVVKFSDGHGSGIDPASVNLLINGHDVTSQAVLDSAMVAFRPGQPLMGVVHAEIKLADKCGNAVDYSWTFEAVPSGQGR